MNKKLTLIISLLFAFLGINAQSADPVALKINGKPIYKSEIEKAYVKYNHSEEQLEKQSFDNFLQSYIEFRLNVEEAKAQQLDTTASYRREYYSYKAELGQAYLKDTTEIKSLLTKYYQRLLQDVRINHVLLPYEKKGMILPSDTLELYNKALSKRNELLSLGFKGKGFIDNRLNPSLVMDLASVSGHLGWITAFMLPLQLENAMYNMQEGGISMPIRTQRGYHLIQVLGRRPAVGAVRVDQVLFNFPTIPPSAAEIDSVGVLVYDLYDKMKSEQDFQVLCDRFSQAFHTGAKKCDFGIVKLDSKNAPSFINTALNLEKVGDVSEPVMTDYGYHILRLTAKIPIPGFEQVKPALSNMALSGDRGEYYRWLMRRNLEYKFGMNINSLAFVDLQNAAAKFDVDDPSFAKEVSNPNKALITIGGRNEYTVGDFLNFAGETASVKAQNPDELPSVITLEEMYYNLSADKLASYFTIFAINKLMDYAEETLEERYPDFRLQMKEYSDGILLFDVKNKNVWEKAQNDEAGLIATFNENRAKYKWDEPLYKGVVFYCKDEETMRKVESLYLENGKNETALSLVRTIFNKEETKVIIESDIWGKGDNSYVDNKVFGENKTITPRHNYPYAAVVGRFISEPETFSDVRAAVEEDYMKKVEDSWVSSLRNKYKVEQNKSVLKSIERLK